MTSRFRGKTDCGVFFQSGVLMIIFSLHGPSAHNWTGRMRRGLEQKNAMCFCWSVLIHMPDVLCKSINYEHRKMKDIPDSIPGPFLICSRNLLTARRGKCILLWWELYQVFKDMQLWLKVFKNSYTYWIHCPSINHIVTDRRKWQILHRGHDKLLNLSFQIQ